MDWTKIILIVALLICGTLLLVEKTDNFEGRLSQMEKQAEEARKRNVIRFSPVYDDEGFRLLGPDHYIKLTRGYEENVKVVGRGRVDIPLGGYCANMSGDVTMDEDTLNTSQFIFVSPPKEQSVAYTIIRLLEPSECIEK